MPEGHAVRRKRGLLLVPEFPYDSFWSYRYVMRLIGRKAAFPPLGLLSFAGYLPDEWDLELVDMNVSRMRPSTLREKIDGADAAFVTAMSIQKRSLVQLLAGPARGTGTPFVLGGPFASSYRDEMLTPRTPSDQVLHDGLDVLVWGEAQHSVEALLSFLATSPRHDDGTPRLLIPEAVARAGPGSRDYLNRRDIFRPLDEVPPPRWDLIRTRDYHSMSIQTTAGCPFRCDFCDIIQFNGGFNRPKPPRLVRRELEAIVARGYRGSVFSVDDNFIGQPAAMEAILDEMIAFQREHGYPFSFYTQASVNLGTPKLEPLLRRMKRAGFGAVFLGIENPDADALRRMNKKQNVKVDVPVAIRRIQAAGLEVYAGFILGGDDDTVSTADRIVEFASRTRIFTAMVGLLTPVPHTPLHQRLSAEGRLRRAEYSGNNTDDEVQFEPQRMSQEEMRDAIHETLRRLFQPAQAYRRALAMLEAVRPHLFTHRRLEPAYLKAAVVSLWRQGLRRHDRDYFALLWRSIQLDRRRRRQARRELRRLRRLRGTALPGPEASATGPAPDRLDALLDLAQDYLVRFRDDMALPQVSEWAAELRTRLRSGMVAPEEMKQVYCAAVRGLKLKAHHHRFPGITLTRAFEAAIKGLHYEQVMRSIVGTGQPPEPLSHAPTHAG